MHLNNMYMTGMKTHLAKPELLKLFDVLRTDVVYKKTGDMIARPAQPGETVIVVNHGKIEVIKKAEFGDWVIRNIIVGSSGESYLVTGKKFTERYDRVSDEAWFVDGQGWYHVKPKGMIVGGFYTYDKAKLAGLKNEPHFIFNAETITFASPWGTEMILQDGDFLGTPYPALDLNDIYRVERSDFETTYGTKPFSDLDGVEFDYDDELETV